jgi:hypothetical protein
MGQDGVDGQKQAPTCLMGRSRDASVIVRDHLIGVGSLARSAIDAVGVMSCLIEAATPASAPWLVGSVVPLLRRSPRWWVFAY